MQYCAPTTGVSEDTALPIMLAQVQEALFLQVTGAKLKVGESRHVTPCTTTPI